jgi:hypothetical protein
MPSMEMKTYFKGMIEFIKFANLSKFDGLIKSTSFLDQLV